MSDASIIDGLDSAARRGVDVEVCMTDSSRWRGAFGRLTSAGVHVVTYASDAPLYIHAKAIVVDAATPAARVFVGSENFSAQSLDRNRELGVVLRSTTIVDGVARTIQSDVRGGHAWR
jgi:cardiolipin synthase A/B